ncbi:hypothetical protein SODG_006672 [Sodalis praecaptivus]
MKINVAANTARAYADLCATGLRLMTTRHSIELQQQSVDLTRRLLQAGRTGELDIVRARAQLQQLNATLPPLEARRPNSLYQLATLTGNLPQDFPRQVADCTTPPRLTQVIPVGDGAALLRRRPDIRQNERRLAAATARIGVAMADLYPKITLGLDGSSAGLLSGIGKRTPTVGALVRSSPRLYLPVARFKHPLRTRRPAPALSWPVLMARY